MTPRTTPVPADTRAHTLSDIVVRGAREHNLKDITLRRAIGVPQLGQWRAPSRENSRRR